MDKNGVGGVIGNHPHGSGRYVFTAINEQSNRIYVLNTLADITGTSRDPGFVSAIDGSTNNVIANIPVGNQPFGIAANKVTNRIYVANAGQGGAAPGGITIIDGNTNTAEDADTSAFATQGFRSPMVVNEAANKVYFLTLSFSLGVLDGNTKVAIPFPTPISITGAMAVNNILNRLYLTTPTGVAVIDGATNNVIANISLSPAGSMAISETTNRLFVTNPNNDTLTVVDCLTNSVIAVIPVGDNPTSVAVNELANRIYVGNRNTRTVSVIDGFSLTVAVTVPVSLDPGILTVDRAVSRLYVSTLNAHDLAGAIVISDLNGVLGSLTQAIIAAFSGAASSSALLYKPLASKTGPSSNGIRDSMLRKVEHASAALERQQTHVAINILTALANQVEAQRGKAVDIQSADHILALISAAINGL
jgi:YVTN family beta-propeller protein